ncbi:MAG TPA: M28 family metallopeptidase [Acidobacteriaceae bacterium]|nr:M28 family metallopeptidase [Acidobacteriaceae bacterium]
MTSLRRLFLPVPLAAWALFAQSPAVPARPAPPSAGAAALPASPAQVFGFRSFARQAALDREFLAVPDPALARHHLQVLTAVPHWASSPEDYATAVYVADQFKAAGLETRIVPYSVLIPRPVALQVEAFDSSGTKILSGLTPESPQSRDPRILPPFSSGSASGDLTAPVVYANYGRREDFDRLARVGIGVKGKIVLIRYGQIFRGTKIFLAEQAGAAGVLLFTDPADASLPDVQAYPDGPNPPETAVQRGSVQFLSIYPGDPTTPGVASVPSLPAPDRIPVNKLQYDLPSIPSQPISALDAVPILRALAGPQVPDSWQGSAIGSPYHIGSPELPVTVHMHVAFDTRLRTIWDVIGRIPGIADPGELVVVGNHRDAWVYGAVDPSSATASLLETVQGLGVLRAHGWRPRRTIVIASWDAEEQGLIGSTEWVEQHMDELRHAVAYFNIDMAASGPNFVSAAVPSLHRFLREIAAEVPASSGNGSVLDQWLAQQTGSAGGSPSASPATAKVAQQGPSAAAANAPADQTGLAAPRRASVPRFGDLGSGSDYSPFLDHAGVPSTDIGSDGPFGVYHSIFDNFDWYARFVDPDFSLAVQQARILGLEALHMADADVLPTDELAYARSIRSYIEQARKRAASRGLSADFSPALSAADSFLAAANTAHNLQLAPPLEPGRLNGALIASEHSLLIPEGLPQRPWYRHAIYAPGLLTGYSPEVLPGINDAIDAGDASRLQAQLAALTDALHRADDALASASR